MKINTDVNSRFLAQKDIPAPIIVTIDTVTEDRSLRNKDVLSFLDSSFKPFPLNWHNRNVLVAAYGADSDLWRGKPIEIYVDPTVPNPTTPSRPGGIRVRIPTVTTVLPTQAAPIPTQAAPTPKPTRTLEENFAWGLTALDAAKTEDRLDEVAIAMGRLPLNELQAAMVQRRYERNMARLAPKPAPAPAAAAK